MSFISKPTIIPRWANNGGIVTQPTEGKKDIGWLTNEHPPAQFLNWLFFLLCGWVQYFLAEQQMLGNIVYDHFVGSAIDTGKWSITGLAVAQQDWSGGANGVVQFTQNSGNHNSSIATQPLFFGTADFTLICTVKPISHGSSALAFTFGKVDVDSHDLYFTGSQGGNWFYTIGTASGVDTGIAVSSANYQELRINRTGGVAYMYIDGVQVYTGAYAASVGPATIVAGGLVYVGSGSTIWFADKVSVWIDDSGTSTAALGAHSEKGVGAMSSVASGSGGDYLDVTFSRQFGDATYGYTFDPYNSGDGTTITLTLVTKTAFGMRIKPSAKFDGEISWSARP